MNPMHLPQLARTMPKSDSPSPSSVLIVTSPSLRHWNSTIDGICGQYIFRWNQEVNCCVVQIRCGHQMPLATRPADSRRRMNSGKWVQGQSSMYNSLRPRRIHCDDVIMSEIASQITSLTIVYPTVLSGADQSKHQSSASLAFVWEIHRWPVNFPHKWPVTRKIVPFDDVIMYILSKIIIVVSDNGFSPDRLQAISWNNAGMLLIRPPPPPPLK